MNETNYSNRPRLPVWRGTWELIRFRPGFFAVNVIFVTTWIVTRLVPGWVEKLFYDRLTGSATTAVTLWGILGMLVAFEAARLASDITGEWGGMRLRNAAGSLMRKNIVRAILNKPGARPLPVSAGDAINRLSDDLADYADFPTWIPEVLGHGLFTLAALVIMLSISPLITLVTLLPLAGVFFFNRYAWSRFLRYGHESRTANSQVTGFLGEIFGAVQAIKVADATAGAMGYFHLLNDNRRRLNVRYATFLAIFRAATDHLGDIAVAVMVLLAGSAIAGGDFSVGDFALFSTYLFFAARFPATIGSYLSEIAQQRVVLDRMQELVPDMPPPALVAHSEIYEKAHQSDAAPAEKPQVPFVTKTAVHRLESVRVAGLSFQFGNQSSVNSNQLSVNGNQSTTVTSPITDHRLPTTGPGAPNTKHRPPAAGIDNVSFTLQRGSFTVITGRIGGGKTTLLRLLLGLLPASGGEIFWNGARVPDPATFFVPPRSAYTPQVPRLFSEALRDNILMGLPALADLETAIHRAVLEEDVTALENGLDTVVGPRGVRLSGGQVQRSAAARMFVRNAELLVFDDLSSALDVETEQQLWQRLRGSGSDRDNVTCLVVSHRKAALQLADQILVMENGRIAARGNLDELLMRSPLMQELWHGSAGNKGRSYGSQ